MTDEHHTIQYGREPGPDEPGREAEVEVLMGRLIDGESSSPDRVRFEAMAAREPRLWRALALRHQDSRRLERAFELEAGSALETELPAPRPAGEPRVPAWRWGLAVSGWAAMLLVGIAWAASTMSSGVGVPAIGLPAAEDRSGTLSADQHFERYLAAPNVLGELEVLVLEVQELPDGRAAVRYMRRVEEVAFIDSPDELPISEDGRTLTVRPDELRARKGVEALRD